MISVKSNQSVFKNWQINDTKVIYQSNVTVNIILYSMSIFYNPGDEWYVERKIWQMEKVLHSQLLYLIRRTKGRND